MMKKVVIFGGAIVLLLIVFPSLKGAFYHMRNTVNDDLNDRFVVDNYKQKYVELHDKKVDCAKSIRKFTVEQTLNGRKIESLEKQSALLKAEIIRIGTSDPEAFRRTREQYEIVNAQIANHRNIQATYSNALVKLNHTMKVLKANLDRSKLNIASLESKKECVDTLKSVNSIVEDVNGIGESDLGVSVEKLKDDEIRETVRMETLLEPELDSNMSTDDIEKYINSLK